MVHNLLIEIGCEELPPKSLQQLSDSFKNLFVEKLNGVKLSYSEVQSFCTPRRLALIIHNLSNTTPAIAQEYIGPPVAIAFDKEGNPTKAATAFLTKNNLTDLILENDLKNCVKNDRLFVSIIPEPLNTVNLLEDFINSSLKDLPIPKRMRWGSSRNEFVRPIKWVTVVFGNDTVATQILGVQSNNLSYGHRFMAPQPFVVTAQTYESELHKHSVIVDVEKRKKIISDNAQIQASTINGKAQISVALLNEVAALVEWPIVIMGKFDAHFLSVPPEALISSMASHQKYFHVFDSNEKLLPNFITVANIASLDMQQVIEGNERVIRPRLNDAAFFFETDKKTTLVDRCDQLKPIVFQKELGSVYDKTQRVSKLAAYIAELIGSDPVKAARAGILSKSDLVSEMVLEFNDLQGLMGKYYAIHDGENADVALALYEQYLPISAGSELPQSQTGCALALADRIDTLIGIFGIGQQPTGNRDPFALRRATLGILNIIIHHSLNLNLTSLYTFAFNQFPALSVADSVSRALEYTFERFRAFYNDQGIATEVYLSVAAMNITNPLDFNLRVNAVHQFSLTSAAISLASANKRVANILSKNQDQIPTSINVDLLLEPAEKALFATYSNAKLLLNIDAKNYAVVLGELATLKPEIDAFFDTVMVMVEDQHLRKNRLAILNILRTYFLQVADISLLVTK